MVEEIWLWRLFALELVGLFVEILILAAVLYEIKIEWQVMQFQKQYLEQRKAWYAQRQRRGSQTDSHDTKPASGKTPSAPANPLPPSTASALGDSITENRELYQMLARPQVPGLEEIKPET